MRIVLWLGALLAVCAVLLVWNDRITKAARAERDELRHGRDAGEASAHAIVGEKSGAPFVEPERPPVPVPKPVPGTDPRRGSAPQPGSKSEHVVVAGESLSTICQAHYGTARTDLVAAVARANHLEKVDQVRAGMKLVLPPLSELGVEIKMGGR